MSLQTRKLAAQRRRETVKFLWTRYAENRDNVELRNRLVEHYTPMAQEIAREFIEQYRLREVDTAVGDVLLLLVLRIIPQYDGVGSFRVWATTCIRRKLLDRKRLESRERENFEANYSAEDIWPAIEAKLVRPAEPGAELRFAELAAALPARDGALLWLQFYRHLSDRQIAAALNMTSVDVRRRRRLAMGVLRKLAGEEKSGVRSQTSGFRPPTSDS